MNKKLLNQKAFYITVFALATMLSATAAKPQAEFRSETPQTSRIESQRGEKWWGVFAGNSPVQPHENPFEVDTEKVSADGIRIPMLVSNAGRYVWSPQPATIGFDGSDFTIRSEHEKITPQKGGKNLREAYLVCAHRNFPPDGTLPPIDLLTMPVYNTRIEFGYLSTQDEIVGYADRILAADLPPGILLLADGWRSYNGGFDFDREHFPDPRRMVEQLHNKGFKVMLTVTPLTGAYGRPYAWGAANDMFVRGGDGQPHVIRTEDGYGVCFDLSRPEVAGYCRQRIDELQSAYGIDGFRFDCRALMRELANAQYASRFLENWRALGDGIALCDFIPGTSSPLKPVVQGILADTYSGWQGLRAMMCNVLSAGLIGSPYVYAASDEAVDRQELFADDVLMTRLIQLSAWMPVAEIPFGTWWIADDGLRAEAVNAIRKRAQLADYVSSLVRESARTGEPLVRHMEYQFPRNGFSDCNHQFMLGNKYLFAPVVADEPARTVRLPRGVWIDADGKRFKGPVVTSVNTANGRMICFELSGK